MNYDTEIQIHKNSIGSKTKLQESLLEAVQILHDGFIVNEKIPKTLECRIADDSKKDKGIYTVDYMNNKFEVSCFLDETFNVNDIVCVLVPDGDFAKTKIIIGSSDGSGEGANWVTQEQLDQAVTTLQINFQAGVDAIGDACKRKGSIPASSSLEDTVAAIDAIQTGGNYATLEVREDGTYRADEDPRGIDAYDIVIVSKDAGQPHTVVFYGPDGNIIKTQANVPYHGYASCTLLDGTIRDGQYFKGQNPVPSNVVEDIDCYPQYGDYIINPGGIEDDQETICADCGAHYPLGAYKSLVISVPYYKYPTYVFDVRDGSSVYRAESPYLETSRVDISVEMIKVAEGEDGSTSSQLSRSPIYFGGSLRDSGSGNDSSNFLIYARTSAGGYNADFDWGACFARMFLHEMVLTNLPSSLQRTIKSVNKTYWGYTPVPTMQRTVSVTLVQKTSLDKIQIPSAKELYTQLETMEKYDTYNYESQGIDYTAVASLITGMTCCTRSSRFYNSNTPYIQQLTRYDGLHAGQVGGGTYSHIGFCL